MKITLISDTHGRHRSLSPPLGDMIIHAGDISGVGQEEEIADFFDWYSGLDFTHKILIAGNHDFFFEKAGVERLKTVIPKDVIYLEDNGINIEGVNIWGSPITPWFNNWAFNRQRGKEIKEHWKLIPKDTDILITHGPPRGVLDRNARGIPAGCDDLLKIIQKLKPKYHIFGHIHEGHGSLTKGQTTFVNASVLDERYELVNGPVSVEWKN
ncbi:metallophosphatase domain-containing protein [Negadavirga shengliensis]|uniref:Metallophosphatase domain-containing protein n=1 Tax=Negadavirga shengliensis TaxID=1389218 RepID=A0ABV9SZX6_9BACT